MKSRFKKLVCLLLFIVVVVGVSRRWLAAAEVPGLQSYAKVSGGMTVEEVRQIFGREEDPADERKTATGEFERSWTFGKGRFTVVFDCEGRSYYKELAPAYCGVTPLMDKYEAK